MEAFLLSSHWYDSETSTNLVFWWRTSAGVIRQQVLQPSVCFIERSDTDKAIGVANTLQWPIEIRAVPLKHFNGSDVSACYMPSFYIYRWRDVLKGQGINCREVDIRPTDRYLMERFIYGEADVQAELIPDVKHDFMHAPDARVRVLTGLAWRPKFKCLSLDIETSFPRRGQPDRLFSVGLYADDYQHVFMIGNQQNQSDITFYNSESDLLSALLFRINEYDPDIIMGWNIVQFDFDFLRRKYLEHHINFSIGRDGSELDWRQSKTNQDRVFLSIAGRVVLDGIDLLKNATFQFESFALNDVAQYFLADQKLLTGDDRGGDIEHLFIHNKQDLARYNLKDCELVWRIFEKADLLNFAIERSRMTGLLMDRMGGSVAAFENLYLPRLHREGYIAPNINDGYSVEKSPGGYVLDSRPGLFEHVIVLDFKSLYPSIIRTFCIDPMGLIEGLNLPETSIAEKTSIPGFFGGRFHQQKHILPDLIRMLGDKREQAKKEKNHALSQAIKVIMASCYGVLGSEGCRFYDTRLSASITKRGHQIILESCQWIREQGFDVIYGDTDSVFVWLKDELGDAETIGRSLVADLNAWWTRELLDRYNIESFLEMEYDVYYRRFFMPSIRGSEAGSKKRYAGLIKVAGKDEIVFKGLEAVRSDWTPLARNFQKELYRRIFLNEPYAEWLRSEIQALLAGARDDQLVYRKRLRQPLGAYLKNVPPHAQAAEKIEQWLLLKGFPSRFANRGGRIEYRVTTNGPEPLWPDGSSGSAPDYSHYLEKQIRPLAEAIFMYTGDDFSALSGLQLSLF